MTTLQCDSSALCDDLAEQLPDGVAFQAWPGGKFRSGVIGGSGRTQVSWAFFAATAALARSEEL